MEIYLLIGVVYAFFSRDADLGIYGFIRSILFWPFDILKNFWIGWNSAKRKDQHIAKVNIKLCQDSMEEFHNILADTILEETGKSLSELPEKVRMGMVVYEIQAALAAAQRFRIAQQYHYDFASATLTKGGMPRDAASGMVHAALSTSSGVTEWGKEAVDGKTGYEQLTLGKDSLAEHVKNTLSTLKFNHD